MGHQDEITNDLDSAVEDAVDEFEHEKKRRREDGDVQKTRMQ